ncbi:hypothetical protein BU23DRAFT_628009 [Bimuria novae-zelandiae CBS 107.79]|uniref:Uncharacterized protein n=1 Tax=Bimuria novae-zelandiae CBS 107.79 TaxID=1447943 RepID=A0A6A5VH60_9PLEO|nr:hypothetical protein BU23DRAFT_628009 [Bimuria novae-zelandiae CBS 107.79]
MQKQQPVKFEHEQIPDNDRYIRLLKIAHDKRDQLPVRCELSTWPLVTAPVYDAISYTWGDPSEATDILLNESQFLVRGNCEYVLQQIRALNQDQHI